MSFFSKLFNAERPLEYKIQEIDSTSINADNNEEIVAAIMGSVMAMMQDNAITDIKIKSIRRIGRTSPVWNLAGRDEYIAAKL